MAAAVDEADAGVVVSFPDLVAFATWGGQIIDGIFVAIRPGTEPPARVADDEAVLGACAMLVAVIDSGCWLVSAPPPVTHRLRVAWEAEDVAPGDVVLSVWGR